jgi:hypothetical protein
LGLVFGALVLPLALTACGSGSTTSGDDVRAQQARDFERLSLDYERVSGDYEGDLAFSESGQPPQAARLSVYKVFINDGVNPDGTTRVRPTLRARFYLTNIITTETDDLILSGDYNPVSGLLVLTSNSASGAASGPFLSLEGQAGRDAVDVKIARRGGQWGRFQGRLANRESTSTAGGSVAEERARRLRIFEQVQGLYVGELRSSGQAGLFRCVDLNLYVAEQVSAQGSVPILMAQFYFTRGARDRIGGRSMSVDWNSQTGEIAMREIAEPGRSSPPGSQVLSIQGRLQAGASGLDVRLVSSRGELGRVTTQLGAEPTSCASEREAGGVSHDVVAGLYEGRLVFPGTPAESPEAGRLSIYKVYVNEGTNPDGSLTLRPSLRGRFRLDNVITDTDDVQLVGDFDEFTGQLVLTSIGAGGTAAGPGDTRFLSIEGKIGQADLSLAVTRKGGLWGRFESRRVADTATSSAAGEQSEERQRRLRILNGIEGRYVGRISNIGQGLDFKCADFTLFVAEQMTQMGMMPALLGQFYFTRLADNQIGGRSLALDWNSQTGEVAMRETGGASGPNPVPGSQVFSAQGTLKSGQLNVTLTNFRGKIGDVEAKRNVEPALCRQERQSSRSSP